jgi:hypothetical protein
MFTVDLRITLVLMAIFYWSRPWKYLIASFGLENNEIFHLLNINVEREQPIMNEETNKFNCASRWFCQ